MRYGSVCSGIEAASVAWHPMGWRAAWLAEIEPFPSAVLAHRFPEVANLGDMTNIARGVLTGEVEAPDVLVGGTPCQAFSVAGMREGLADARGQLTIKFVELADAIDLVRVRRGAESSVIVWENVPGVLSSKDNAFGCFLAALAGEDDALVPPGGGKWSNAGYVLGPARAIAWRVLDAQYFGVAQRRRRVFLVASARKDFDPRSVLFESEGVRRDSAPSRSERKEAAGAAGRGAAGGDVDADGLQHVVGTLCADTHPGAYSGQGAYTGRLVPHFFDAYQHHGWRASDTTGTLTANMSRGVCGDTPLAVHGTQDPDVRVDLAHTLGRNHGQENAIAYGIPGNWIGRHGVAHNMAVRRLTPTECERLQGFPDGWTSVPFRGKPASDGPRYKALGNSMAVPCMAWIGNRIKQEFRA